MIDTDPQSQLSAFATSLDEQYLAEAISRLSREFEASLPGPTVTSVLTRCRYELDIVSGPSLPELVERLGRQRLLDLCPAP